MARRAGPGASVYLTRYKPAAGKDRSWFLPNWPQDLKDDEIVSIVREKFSRQIYYGDALPLLLRQLRCGRRRRVRGQPAEPGAGDGLVRAGRRTSSLSDIRIAVDPENPWWRRVKRVTKRLAEAIGPNVQISMTDIGGNLDILASLRGTDNLLTDLIDQPEEVRRCAREITTMWLAIYDELHRLIAPHCPGSVAWAPVWAPDRTYMLQSDFSYMISPAHFKEFVLPDLKACCDSLKYSFYHLDGVGQLSAPRPAPGNREPARHPVGVGRRQAGCVGMGRRAGENPRRGQARPDIHHAARAR